MQRWEGLCVTCHSTLLWYLHVSHTAAPGHSSAIWAGTSITTMHVQCWMWSRFEKSLFEGSTELDTLFIFLNPILKYLLEMNFLKYTISAYIYSQTHHVQNPSKWASFKWHVQSPKPDIGLNFHPLSVTLH